MVLISNIKILNLKKWTCCDVVSQTKPKSKEEKKKSWNKFSIIIIIKEKDFEKILLGDSHPTIQCFVVDIIQ